MNLESYEIRKIIKASIICRRITDLVEARIDGRVGRIKFFFKALWLAASLGYKIEENKNTVNKYY